MLISIHPSDDRPIYVQIMDEIRRARITGAVRPDEPLPSVRQLAAELRVNPMTVQQAYRELERDGWIYSVPGKGSFVAARPKEPNAEAIAAVHEQFIRLVKEARFLGVTNEQLWQWIIEGEEEEENNDSTRRRDENV